MMLSFFYVTFVVDVAVSYLCFSCDWSFDVDIDVTFTVTVSFDAVVMMQFLHHAV